MQAPDVLVTQVPVRDGYDIRGGVSKRRVTAGPEDVRTIWIDGLIPALEQSIERRNSDKAECSRVRPVHDLFNAIWRKMEERMGLKQFLKICIDLLEPLTHR
jgi:hypothetical protein